MLGGAPVRRVRDVAADDQPARCGGGGFDVFGVGAHVADMGERERDDLTGIGRVRQDFLVARNRGVEADLADGRAGGADAAAPDCLSAAEDENGGGAVGRCRAVWRAGFRLCVGHRVGSH